MRSSNNKLILQAVHALQFRVGLAYPLEKLGVANGAGRLPGYRQQRADLFRAEYAVLPGSMHRQNTHQLRLITHRYHQHLVAMRLAQEYRAALGAYPR